MRFAGIETTDFVDDEILFFVRIKGRKHFFTHIYGERAIEALFGHVKCFKTISEYPGEDHWIDLDNPTVAELESADYEMYYSAGVHEALPAIIARCRGLRSIEFAEAKELVLLVTRYFRRLFTAHRYRLIVFHVIDNYVLDVMYRVAARMGIQSLCLSEWFIAPYRRHTIFGELHPTREPDEAEISTIVEFLSTPRKSFWLDGVDRANRFALALRLLVRTWIIQFVRGFWGHRVLRRRGYEYRFARHLTVQRLSNLWVHDMFDSLSLEELERSRARMIVLPLHTYPEANVDYWMSDFRDADYFSTIYEALTFFRERGYIVLVKEHPGFVFQRERSFYRTVKSFENVRLIDPFSSTSALLDSVPLLLVWHGSMGIEAMMQGRKVVCFDTNYYAEGVVPSYRNFESAHILTSEERREFVRQLLRGVQTP